MDLHFGEDSVDYDSDPPSCDSDDLEFLYESLSSCAPSGKTVIFHTDLRNLTACFTPMFVPQVAFN